jgi:hypothetical protein
MRARQCLEKGVELTSAPQDDFVPDWSALRTPSVTPQEWLPSAIFAGSRRLVRRGTLAHFHELRLEVPLQVA